MIPWMLSACGLGGPPAVRELSLPGVVVRAPASFVDLEPDKVERLRQAALAAAPDQDVTVVAVRHPDGLGQGSVQLQRSVDPDATRYGDTVRAALETLEADLRTQLAASGASVVTVDATEREGGREICSTVELTDGTHTERLYNCVLAAVDPEKRVVLSGINCMGGDPAFCAEVLASRRYTPGDVLPMDAPLPAPVATGVPGISEAAAWGVTFGISRDTFRKGCAAAGHRVDAYDWSLEAPVVKEWFDRGRVSSCGGLPTAPPSSFGPVVSTSAIFDQDQLVALTVFLAQAPEAVEVVLAEAWPESMEGQGQILHLIDQQAVEHALISVTVAASGVVGARSSVTFLSARGSTAPL